MKICPSCQSYNPENSLYCNQCGTKIKDELQTGQNLIPLAILFSDVSGFTKVSAQLEPDELISILDPLMELLTNVVREDGGRVLKYEGDAIMAIFGLGDRSGSACIQAVQAGLNMQEKAIEYFQNLIQETKISLSMRVGIHFGKVYAGLIGGTLDVMGDSVNRAKRLEQHAPLNHVLISREVYDHLGDCFEIRAETPIHAKGLIEPIEVYVPLKHKPGQYRLGQIAFFGRDLELSILNLEYQNFLQQQTGFKFLIQGDPGSGKSRLLTEWVQSLDPEIKIIECSFDPMYSSPARLGTSIIKTENPPQTKIVSGEWKDGLRDWMVQIASSLRNAHSKIILLLEDLQWIDESSQALLNYLLLEDLPIGIVATIHKNAKIGHTIEAKFRKLPLAPLSPEAVAQIIQTQSQRTGNSYEESEKFFELSHGNPWTLSLLLDNQKSLSLSHRILSLPKPELKLLEILSISSDVSKDLLQAAFHHLGHTTFESSFKSLLGTGLILQTQNRIRISHNLLRDEIMNLTPKKERSKIHATLATLMLNLPEYSGSEQLIQHLLSSSQKRQAAIVALNQCQKSLGLGIIEPFLKHDSLILSHFSVNSPFTVFEKTSFFRALTEAYSYEGLFKLGLSRLANVYSSVSASDPLEDLAWRHSQFKLSVLIDEPKTRNRTIHQLLQKSLYSLGEEAWELETDILISTGWHYYLAKQPRLCTYYYNKAATRSRATGQPLQLVTALTGLASARRLTKKLEATKVMLQEALSLAITHGLMLRQGLILSSLAKCEEDSRDFQAALSYSEKAKEILESYPSRLMWIAASSIRASALFELKRQPEALAEIETAIQILSLLEPNSNHKQKLAVLLKMRDRFVG